MRAADSQAEAPLDEDLRDHVVKQTTHEDQADQSAAPTGESNRNILHALSGVRSAGTISRVPPIPGVTSAVSSGNVGGLIVPPVMQRSAHGAQSERPATDGSFRPRGQLVGSDGPSVSVRPPRSQAADIFRVELFKGQVAGAETLRAGSDGEGTPVGARAVGGGGHAGWLEQRCVRPCLSMSPSTVSCRPGAVRGTTSAPVSPSTSFGRPSAVRSQIVASTSPPTVSARVVRTVRGQETAPVSPSTVSGPPKAVSSQAMASISPCTVSSRSLPRRDQSTAPVSTVAVSGRSAAVPYGVRGRPPSEGVPSSVRPRMLQMGAYFTEATSPVRSSHSVPQSGGGNGGAGLPGGESQDPCEQPGSLLETTQSPPASNTGASARMATGGRPKGTSSGKSCHGCRNSQHQVKGGTKVECDSEEFCNYWLCLGCFDRWKIKSGEGTFRCCLHGPGTWCPCKSRVHPPKKGRLATLDRSEKAKNRVVGTSVFELPTPPMTPADTTTTVIPTHTPSAGSTTYSVCTSVSLLRVAVIKAGGAYMCSRGNCRSVETLSSAAEASPTAHDGDTESVLPGRCPHADVVREREASLAPIPTAESIFAGADLEQALERVPAGTFNESTLRAMRDRSVRATEEGVPLLVRIGDTNWYAVRDGEKFNRIVIGEWAHVKCNGEGESKAFQCKANNGTPCSDSSSRKRTGRCVHAAIVAVHMFNGNFNNLDIDDVMDGVELGPDVGLWGEEEDGDDGGGLASYTQQEDPVRFGQQLGLLRMITSLYRFPVEEPFLKEGTYGRGKIHVNGRICTGCGRPYEQLVDSDATLLAQGPQGADLRVVKLEQKVCNDCSSRGWAGDDIYEDGVFNYNGNVVIELRVLYQLRRAVRAGHPISTWVRTFLQPRVDDMRWLRASRETRILASRLADHNFHAVVKEAYFAFEALSEHPYDFTSYLHGHSPELLCIDGCAKIATDNVSTTQFEVARVERYVDTDLQHTLLKMSMISKMVFKHRLRWVVEAAPTFGPHNRVSNSMLRTQRGKMAPEGSPENGDVGELMRALGDSAISDLPQKTFADLQNIYKLCFAGARGISRYSNKAAFIKCFEDLWKSGGGDGGGRCSKLFVGRPSRASAGVEGLFAPDGVMCAHVFQLTAESPADAVDIMAHLLVQPGLLITDVPCMMAPIADKRHPGLLENGGALPRNAEGRVSLPGLQHIGAHAHEFPDKRHVKLPPRGFPSAPSFTTAGADPLDNVYAVFAKTEPSRPLQAHVDFHALLGRAAEAVEENRQRDAAASTGAEDGIGGSFDASSSHQRMYALAEETLKSLHADGVYAMTLFEVVFVYALWFQAAGYGRVDDGMVQDTGRGGDSEGEGLLQERAITDLTRSELLSISSFFSDVIRVAVGSTTSSTGFNMNAPEFFTDDILFDLDQMTEHHHEAPPPPRPVEDAIDRYVQEKVSYITNRLGAENENLHQRAYDLVRAGVGFGVAEHSVKALQMALSPDGLGGGVDESGRLPGYSISFNFLRERSFDDFGHFYGGKRVGLWLAPDGPHEGNHQGPCQEKYGGVARCPQLTGANCNVHEQNHSKKTKHLPSVSGMGFDTFTFNVNLINELENAAINRKTCSLAVTRATSHPHDQLHACCAEVWICGRCFCSSPLMRSFDECGKLRITRAKPDMLYT